MFVTLVKSFEFDAAHHLPCFPEGHKCRNLHGHTYRVDLVIEGDMPDDQHYLVDFGDIKAVAEPVRAMLDHTCLNDIEGMKTPTAERICEWIHDRIKPHLPLLTMVRVYETPTSYCEYRGPSS
jgi:6-pyruvoyltetrahydropterin/6-carboxytetrahydropterin synthase